jgi:hypothetical protein
LIVDPAGIAEKSNPRQQVAYSAFLPGAQVAYVSFESYASVGLVQLPLNPVVSVYALGCLVSNGIDVHPPIALVLLGVASPTEGAQIPVIIGATILESLDVVLGQIVCRATPGA